MFSKSLSVMTISSSILKLDVKIDLIEHSKADTYHDNCADVH